MRRFAFLGALLCGNVAAAMPGFGTSFTVEIVDESRKPVAGAFVVAREFVNISQLHGSRTFCERADAARADAVPLVVRLPAAGTSHLDPFRDHALEALAYAPGYCIERTPSARAAAYNASSPPGLRSQGPAPVTASQQVRLNARRVPGDEQRLQYLLGLSTALACGGADWSPRSKQALGELAEAMGREADAIAKSRYQKLLAQRLRGRLAEAARMERKMYDDPAMVMSADSSMPFVRDFLVAPAGTAVRWPTGREPPGTIGLAIALPRGNAHAAVSATMPPGSAAFASTSPRSAALTPTAPVAVQAPPAESTRVAVHCRHGAPSACDLDERDAEGRTAISRYAEDLDVEAVELLLSLGASPSVPMNVRDADAFDALVARIVQRPPAAGSIDSAKAGRILALMAASPGATIRAGLGADIDDSPQWKMADEARGILIAQRDRLRALPRRDEVRVACPPVEVERTYDPLPVRLRGS